MNDLNKESISGHDSCQGPDGVKGPDGVVVPFSTELMTFLIVTEFKYTIFCNKEENFKEKTKKFINFIRSL